MVYIVKVPHGFLNTIARFSGLIDMAVCILKPWISINLSKSAVFSLQTFHISLVSLKVKIKWIGH